MSRISLVDDEPNNLQGLAIARSIIVDRHGGTIRFETALNQGTTFVIRLPIDARAESRAFSKSDVAVGGN